MRLVESVVASSGCALVDVHFLGATLHRSMTHTLVSYEDVDPAGDALYFLRDPLDCEQLGLSVFELSPCDGGKEHDHAHDGQEEVYSLVEGGVTMTVDGEAIGMEPGDALRIDPEHTRQIRNGEEERLLVIAGAP